MKKYLFLSSIAGILIFSFSFGTIGYAKPYYARKHKVTVYKNPHVRHVWVPGHRKWKKKYKVYVCIPGHWKTIRKP